MIKEIIKQLLILINFSLKKEAKLSLKLLQKRRIKLGMLILKLIGISNLMK